jgi:hypothetical protein
MIDTYVMRRPSLIGTKVRERGEAVPEAHLWRLVDGMVRSGRIRPARMTEADFGAAVSKHCPDDASAIYSKLGLEPLQLQGEVRRGRPRGTRTIVATAPVEISV